MLTGKNKGVDLFPTGFTSDLLTKSLFFTSKSLVKPVRSYRKKRRKSTFFCYLYVNIRLNFLLLHRIKLHKSGIYVNLIRCVYAPVFFVRLSKSSKTTSANAQFYEMTGKSTSYEIFYVHLQRLSSPTVCGTTPPLRKAGHPVCRHP